MTSTSFTFIDYAHIDHKSRRAIRSHVMKGKNVGKVRTPRAPLLHRDTTVYNLESSADACRSDIQLWTEGSLRKVAAPDQPNVTLKLLIQVGNELSSLASPFHITARSRRSLHSFLSYVADAVYPVEFCKDRPDPVVTIWFQYMLTDEAFFHCCVALSEACMDFVTGKGLQSSGYCGHMASALRLINHRLSTPDALTDVSLASVIYLCLLSSVREQPQQTSVHFNGLCRMIEARGGVDRVGSLGLTEKTRRIDIDLALQLGEPAKLEQPATPLEAIPLGRSDVALELNSPLMTATRDVDSRVLTAVQDVTKLTHLLNSSVTTEKLNAHAFQDVITTTCYRLLEIRPLNDRSYIHPIAETVHLGLLSLMTTFFVQIGRQRYLSYTTLRYKLKKALDNFEIPAQIDPATHLWLLVIAGISVLDEVDYIWLTPRLITIAENLGCTDWHNALRLLEQYPWVSILHNKLASHLWGVCFSSDTDGK